MYMLNREIGFSKYDSSFPGLDRVRSLDGKYKMYVLIDPRDNTVRYVGQTVDERRRRRDHTTNNGFKSSKRLNGWKSELFAQGLVPTLLVIDSAGYGEWDVVERFYISYYRKLGRLHNVSPGGFLRKKVKLNHRILEVTVKTDKVAKHRKYIQHTSTKGLKKKASKIAKRLNRRLKENEKIEEFNQLVRQSREDYEVARQTPLARVIVRKSSGEIKTLVEGNPRDKKSPSFLKPLSENVDDKLLKEIKSINQEKSRRRNQKNKDLNKRETILDAIDSKMRLYHG